MLLGYCQKKFFLYLFTLFNIFILALLFSGLWAKTNCILYIIPYFVCCIPVKIAFDRQNLPVLFLVWACFMILGYIAGDF